MENRIKAFARAAGADLCGIADVARFSGAPEGFRPGDIYADCRAVVVLAKAMPQGLAFVSPRIAYNHATSINLAELDSLVYRTALEIERMGGIAVPLPSDGPYDYWDSNTLTGKGLLSMRHAAVQAGLGCLGKNTLLLNREYGNLLSLGAVLTNLTLCSDALAEELCIPGCRRCLDACPTHALDGASANQQLCRPHTYTSNDRGFGVVNCNRCRMACPLKFGKRQSEACND